MSSLSVVLRNPVIRASMLTIFFYGFSTAATAPYQSVIGIHELKLGNGVYAVLILLAATINVVFSVAVGVLADRIGRYRSLMLAVILFGITGYGVVFVLPTRLSFVLAVLLMLPIFNSVNALLFANVRSATDRMGEGDAGTVNATVRAAISLAWVLVPGLVGLALAGAPSMLPAYLLACLACCACLGLVLFMLPAQEAGGGRSASTVSFAASFGEVLSPRVFSRLVALALICSMLHVSAAVLPLIMTGAAGGRVADIGAIVGIVAGLEVVFIFLWARLQRRMDNVTALCVGTAVYTLYLALLGFVTQPWHVYALTLPSGFGAAALITIPITYLQDLIRGRPGLGSSLISVNLFMSGGLCAGLFALGTRIADYSGTAILGAGAGLAGAILLMALDGTRAGRPDQARIG